MNSGVSGQVILFQANFREPFTQDGGSMVLPTRRHYHPAHMVAKVD
jgi:hypothetical protein